MKIKTDPTIRSLHGKFPKSNLIMQGSSNKNHTHAKSYAVPNTNNVKIHQAQFSSESKAIFSCLQNSSQEFKTDLQLYTSIFNNLFVNEEKLVIPYHDFFTVLCYASQKSKGYDLTDLTVSNFSTKIDCTATIKCIIANGYLHSIPESNYKSNDFMHHIVSGSVVYCTPPVRETSSSISILPEIFIPPIPIITNLPDASFSSLPEIITPLSVTLLDSVFSVYPEITL